MTRHGDTAAHILVVDDDQRIRQMLTRYFEQEGYRVSVAADGSAMRAQLNDSVDVILLDVVMPGEDGLTLARELRASSDVGIIMLTGRDDVLDRIVGLEVGADDYIAKPFHLREVLARVKSVLRRREPPTMPSGTADEVIRFALMDLTRGRSLEAFDRSIDAQVARLRKKIEADPKNPTLVKSIRNVGYVFTGKVDR